MQHSSLDDDIRSIARSVSREMTEWSPHRHMALNALFRLRTQWLAHGFQGMPKATRAQEICLATFGPNDVGGDRDSFARGARAAAGIVLDGHRPGSTSDVESFWDTIERFGRACDVEMPPRPSTKVDSEDRIADGQGRTKQGDDMLEITDAQIIALVESAQIKRLASDPDEANTTNRHITETPEDSVPVEEEHVVYVGGEGDRFHVVPLDIRKLREGILAIIGKGS